MMNYEVDIAGYKKSLKLFKVSDDLQIAAFILYGDVAVTQHAAKELLARAPEFDIMLTSASKSIPLIYEMARQAGMNDYIVALKSQKVYMGEPLSADVNSITTFQRQKIYIGEDDVEPAEEFIGIEPGQRRRCIHPVVLQFVYHRYGHIETHLVGVAVAEQLVRHQRVDVVAEVEHAYLAHIEMFGQLAHEGVGRSVVHTEREDDRLHRCHVHALGQVHHIFVLEQLVAHF